jgi:hypothetical protein
MTGACHEFSYNEKIKSIVVAKNSMAIWNGATLNLYNFGFLNIYSRRAKTSGDEFSAV